MSYYWALMNLCTVNPAIGGDIFAATLISRVYAAGSMLMGGFVFIHAKTVIYLTLTVYRLMTVV